MCRVSKRQWSRLMKFGMRESWYRNLDKNFVVNNYYFYKCQVQKKRHNTKPGSEYKLHKTHISGLSRDPLLLLWR